ncbi:MAG: SpoIIE family protein phosphatase [Treponema sp.]|jgi:serine phosphatase RsbU (regulator of sigma subunit)|nr:SpoIIE family protein phosphatase [Treponema sp.]
MIRKYFLLTAFFLFTVSVFAQTGGFFWEEPEIFSPRQGSFPVSAFSNDFSAVAWQEITSAGGGNSINVSLAVKENGGEWQQIGNIGGPYPFSGTEPSILSMVIDNRGRIVIAAAAGSSQTEILISADKGRSFSKNIINMGEENSVAPRLFVRADGGYLLFVTRGKNESLSIYYSRSGDAVTWSNFEFFTPESGLDLNFLPTHASIGRTDFVVFQSLTMGGTDTSSLFQLYYKTSDDGGRTWSTAKRFTGFNDPVSNTSASPNLFDNQRPHLTRHGNTLFLVWERRYRNQAPQIYGATINSNGNIAGAVQRLNTEDAYSSNPIGFIYNNNPVAVWFDTRRGNNRVILAQQSEIGWQNHILSGAGAESSFARPVVSKDGAFIFWQSSVRNTNRLYMLAPDRTAAPPRITALNFTPSRATRLERPRVSWNIPADTSGIQGFSWSWSQDENIVPAKNVMVYNTGNTQNLNMELNADKDGAWYFKIAANDWAGNWSDPSTVMYYRKTTPPPALVLNEPDLDVNGYIVSNNFNLSWQPSTDSYVEGYTWNLQYLGTDSAYVSENAVDNPPSAILGRSTSTIFGNQENGTWGFSVSAVDQAGNIGPASSMVFRANKFTPYTNVNYIYAHQDEQGKIFIRLIGRGFTTNGAIDSVVLAQNGKPDTPAHSFNVLSDREIGGIVFEHIEEGEYYLKLNHPVRGWHNTDPFISVERTGTVKFGDYTRQWTPTWTVQSKNIITINPVIVLTVILLFFCLFGAVAAIRGIGGIIQEGQAVKQEAIAIITGDFMPMEKKQKLVRIKKRGGGLRLKLVSFTVALVLLVVIMISTPMYLLMTNMQRETLLQGLWDRSKVLLEGLATSAKAYMPQGEAGLLELGFLPAQSAALPEANYVTITGFSAGSIHSDHVFATNDPNIETKIDTQELRRGVSRITDKLTPLYDKFSTELNEQAKEAVGDISKSISELTREGMRYILSTDAQSQQRLADIQTTIRSLDVRLTETLSGIAGEIGSFPEFTSENIDRNRERTFIFYKPVMYRQGVDENYFRGLIRLEVSLDSIMDAIFRGQFVLLRTIAIVALIGILIGFIFALILSNLIVRPISKLVKHIEIIRDTEDKTKLAGIDINIETKDEIAILGSTINDMTHGLVKAAFAASDLSIGKEIQKKFIPLEVDNDGNKQTSGFKKTSNLDFFGYYEGAKGVSGDYFDYKELDDGRYYAIIKCDVAGKGIPAALIMIQVATMFLGHFRRWKPTQKGFQIEDLVYQINDFIEALGFKGRFAAFSLCLFDSVTGIVRFCNAGDNVIHYYDASEGKKKNIILPQTPATGVLPNFMIHTSGGYSVQTVQIDKGDILMLYTDGIEEGKRKFRDDNFKEILCTEGPIDTPHENHLCGQADEEMGPERVDEIINAVMAKKTYTLKKYHNPEGEAELQFDFSGCEGTVEEAIMAMVSVEKMFRVYKDPAAGEDSRVLVDKKVDEFLRNHFLQYRRYCSHTKEYPENPAYMYYTHIKEDEQYDDLTILGIKRK